MRVLQKMGELYQKKGDNPQAASFFTRVAEVYAQDGFFLKAVALYKQVLKLNPDLVEVNLKLAELHQQLGLMTEAMAFFQVVVGHHERKGDTRATFAILKKMVDLDPDNVSSRLKLAELYAREQMGGEALGEFRRAADWLDRNNRPDERLRVLERIAALEPDNIQLARDLARDYLARGDQKRALAKLQLCFKADPRDIPTLLLLAQAFTALNHTSKTLSVYKELAKLYAERGQQAESREAWLKVERLDPRDADLQAHKAELAQASAPPPPAPRPTGAVRAQPVQAPVAAAAPPPPPPPPPAAINLSREQIHKLLAETDVYVKYGLHDKALEHLRRIFAVDPENLDAHEKAYVIYRAAAQGPQATEQLLNVLRLCTRGLEVERAQPYLDTLVSEVPNHPEMAAFLAVLRPDSGRAGQDPALVAGDAEEEMLLADDALDSGTDDLGLHSATGEEELLADSEEEPMLVEDGLEVVSADEPQDEPLEPGTPYRRSGAVLVPPPPDAGMDYGEAIPFQEEDRAELTQITEVSDVDGALGAYDAGVESAVELPPEEEISLTPSARVPSHPAVTASQYAVEPPSRAAPAPPPPRATPGRTTPPPAARHAPEESGPVAEELNEAGFFLDQGLLDEAREILETVELVRPGLPRTAALQARLRSLEEQRAAEPPTPAPPPPPRSTPPGIQPIPIRTGSYNLADELASELSDLGPEPAAGAEPVADLQYSVEEVFSEFKKGLEKVVQRGDVDTHYDLGIAYKEMGLLDDALRMLEVARQGCQGLPKEVDCLTMVALLQGMRGEWSQAVAAYRDALASPHAAGREVSLRYELGMAYESSGAPGKALHQYLAVQRADPTHRDVAARVGRLSATVRPEEDSSPIRGNGVARPAAAGNPAPPPAKTRKVGYL
jgi:tetratricopeptide (TPR) repeat protein